MIAGVPVVDVHQHLVRLDSLKMPADAWAPPLVAVAPGSSRAYLLEVITAAGAPQEDLAGAQLILNSLELSK